MGQEEQNQGCSNNSSGIDGGSAGGDGGGRSSKKLKQKKVPQRGLGVAQLEKIRLGELQNEEASLLSSTSLISPRASYSSCLGVQRGINFRPNSSSLTPFLFPLATSLSPPNSNFRPSTNFLHPNTVPLPKPVLGFGQGNRPNGEYNLEGQKKQRLDHHGQAFDIDSNVNFPYASIPNWPPPDVIQRTQQFQSPSSLMVNVSSRSSSSSSVINYPLMEPPSSQSSYGNNFTPMWLEDEKNVGMKRLYPFTLGNPSVPSVPSKFSPTYVAPITRSDNNSASSGTGGTSYVEPGYPVFRDPTRSNITSESNPKKVAGKTEDLSGDFLTLGATTDFPHFTSKYSDHSSSQELSEFRSLPYKGSTKDPICHPEPSGSIQQQPFYSFFPPANTPTKQEATTSSTCSDKVGENVDLNLKL